MRTRVIHLIGGRFDGAEMLFYGTIPASMSIEALDRIGSTANIYRREYEYKRKSMRHHGLYTDYWFHCVREKIKEDITT